MSKTTKSFKMSTIYSVQWHPTKKPPINHKKLYPFTLTTKMNIFWWREKKISNHIKSDPMNLQKPSNRILSQNVSLIINTRNMSQFAMKNHVPSNIKDLFPKNKLFVSYVIILFIHFAFCFIFYLFIFLF